LSSLQNILDCLVFKKVFKKYAHIIKQKERKPFAGCWCKRFSSYEDYRLVQHECIYALCTVSNRGHTWHAALPALHHFDSSYCCE
jgi:hypothetical protein